MSLDGTGNTFIPFTISGLTDITASNSNLGNATATTLNITSATPNKIARFDANQYLVSASVDVSDLVPYSGATTTVNLGSQNITTTRVPVAGSDLTNKTYVDTAIAGVSILPLNNTFTGTNTFNNSVITNTTLTTNTTTVSNTLTVANTANASLSNLVRTELNNVLAGYTPATITVGNDFGAITNAGGVYQATSTNVYASLVLGTLTAGEKYSVSLSLKSVDVNNNTNLSLYGSTTPNITGSTGQIAGFSIPPNTTGFTVFTNTITFPVGSTYLLLVYYSQKPGGIDTLYWNAFSMTGMGSVVKNLITPTTALDGANKSYVDGAISAANLLPLNNTWTGTNAFNNTLSAFNNQFSVVSTDVGYTGASFTASTGIASITYSAPTYTANSSASVQGILNLPALSSVYVNNPCVAVFTNLSFPLFAVAPYPYFTLTSGTTVVYTSAVNPSGTITMSFTPPSATLFITIYFKTPPTGVSAPVFSWNTFIMSSYTATVPKLVANGKVGIGITNPVATFQVIGTGNICGGTNYANLNNYMQTGSLTIGDPTKNYGGSTALWTSNTAGLLMECLDNTEIAVHDAGIRVASMMRYNANTFTIGRDMGWGIANTAIAGTLDTAGNITMASGTFRKNSSANANNWASIQEGGAANSPYMEFYYGSLRRGYIGNATASELNLVAENNCDLNVYTGGGLRMIIKNSGLTGFGRDPSYTVDINGNQRVYNGLNANDSMTVYGPNASWGAYLIVGAGTDRSGGATAQVISTNGNLHLDAGNSNDMYYGYYPNSRGTPNTHQFYGSTIVFNSGLPQQDITYAWPVVMNGSRLYRSQAIQKRQYQNNSIGWGGGVNTTYAFYRYNGYTSVRISGKLSYYVSGATRAYPVLRTYSQSYGTFTYWSLEAFTNVGSNHTTFPIDIVLGGGADLSYQTGWFDIYVYNNGNCNTDTNDQLWINVEVLPSSDF